MATQKSNSASARSATRKTSARSKTAARKRKQVHPATHRSSGTTPKRRHADLQSSVVGTLKELPEQVAHGLGEIAGKVGEAASAAAAMTSTVMDDVAHKVGIAHDEAPKRTRKS